MTRNCWLKKDIKISIFDCKAAFLFLAVCTNSFHFQVSFYGQKKRNAPQLVIIPQKMLCFLSQPFCVSWLHKSFAISEPVRTDIVPIPELWSLVTYLHRLLALGMKIEIQPWPMWFPQTYKPKANIQDHQVLEMDIFWYKESHPCLYPCSQSEAMESLSARHKRCSNPAQDPGQ